MPLPRAAASFGAPRARFRDALRRGGHYPPFRRRAISGTTRRSAARLARGEGFTSLYTYPTHLGSDLASFPRAVAHAALRRDRRRLFVTRRAASTGYFIVAVLDALRSSSSSSSRPTPSSRAVLLAAACAIASPILLDPFSAGLSQVPTAALGAGIWLLLLGTLCGCPRPRARGFWPRPRGHLRGETILMLLFGSRWRQTLGSRDGVRAGSWPALLPGSGIFARRPESHAHHGNPISPLHPRVPRYASTRTYLEPLRNS